MKVSAAAPCSSTLSTVAWLVVFGAAAFVGRTAARALKGNKL